MKSPALSSRRTWLTLGLAALAVSALPGASAWMARKAVPEPESDFCLVAPPTPYDPASGLALHAARAVPKDARCPVCGMYPARAPDWAAQLIFSNGDAQFFDSPLSLFMYLGDVARYSPGRSADDVAAQFVTDASGPSRRWIDAKSAFYVVDSSARGPMRAGNLPAFATQQAARQFAEQRGGDAKAFADIDTALVQRLGGRAAHAH